MQPIRSTGIPAIAATLALVYLGCGGASPSSSPTPQVTLATPSPSPTPGAAEAESSPLSRSITVEGVGEVFVQPQVATVPSSVSAWAPDLHSALDNAEAKTRTIEKELLATGASQVKRTGLSSFQEFGPPDAPYYAKNEPGHRASQSLEARLPVSESLSHALGLLSEQLGLDFSIGQVRFELEGSGPMEARAEARRKAIADARANAEQIAREAGLTLGEILSVAEPPDGAQAIRGGFGGGYGDSYGGPAPSGTTVTVRVAVMFAIR